MEIEITLSKEDWKIFQSYLTKELRRSKSINASSFIVLLLVWGFIGAAFMTVFQNISQFHWPTAIGVAAIFAVIFGLFVFELNKLRQLYAPSDSGPFVGTHKFKINEEGIHSEGNGYEGFHSWSIVKRITRSHGAILVFIDTAYGYVFPELQLKNPEEFMEYIVECNKRV